MTEITYTISTEPEDIDASYIESAQNTLREFYANRPEITFLNSHLEYDSCGYDWSVTLSTSFICNIEGDIEPKTITAEWSEGGNSCNSFESFYGTFKLNYQCIRQKGKWYKLEDGEHNLDIAKKIGNWDIACYILQSENDDLKNKMQNQDYDSQQKINNLEKKNSEMQSYIDKLELISIMLLGIGMGICYYIKCYC
jgi:hypothetical protein